MSSECWTIEYVPKVKINLWYAFALLVLAVAVTAMAYLGLLRPQEEEQSIWFQRSGSVMVVCAIWAEIRLFKIDNLVNPSGLVSAEFRTFEPFKRWYFFLRIAGFFIAILGTMVWGYGDIFFDFWT